MTFESGDRIFITEAIFKTMAMMHIDIEGKRSKSIAAISANNFPRKVVEENKGKNIIWILDMTTTKREQHLFPNMQKN